jgi:preprotein translocase subunit SecG
MYTVLTIVHVILCLFLIVVVLLQAGKGGGMGIAFGGGGSQTVFGSSGAGNFLTRLTAIFAIFFFLNSLVLAYLSSQSDSKRLQTLSERKSAAKENEKAANDKIAKDIEKSKGTEAPKTEPGAPGAPKIEITPATPGAPGAPKIETTPAAPAEKAAPDEKAAPAKATESKEKAASDEAPAKPKRKAPKPKDEAAPGESPTPPTPANP